MDFYELWFSSSSGPYVVGDYSRVSNANERGVPSHDRDILVLNLFNFRGGCNALGEDYGIRFLNTIGNVCVEVAAGRGVLRGNVLITFLYVNDRRALCLTCDRLSSNDDAFYFSPCSRGVKSKVILRSLVRTTTYVKGARNATLTGFFRF